MEFDKYDCGLSEKLCFGGYSTYLRPLAVISLCFTRREARVKEQVMIRIRQALTILLSVTVSAAYAEKPNILFIFSDDQCYETIRAHGYTDIDTPNLDRLVGDGTTFSHAYNMGSWSGAVCVASRHMLNTGTFVWRAQKISENIGNCLLYTSPSPRDT